MQLVKIANRNYNNYRQTDAYKSTILRDSINDLYNMFMREMASDTFEAVNMCNETLHFLESYNLMRSDGIQDDNVGYGIPRTV